MKNFVILFFLSLVLLTGCQDLVVDPAQIVVVNPALESSPIDGFWTGTLRDDAVQLWTARFYIGDTGNGIRTLGGILDVLDIPINNEQPFPVQHTEPGVGIILLPDGRWFAEVFITSIWSISGRLIDENTMEISVAGSWPRDLVYTLHRTDGSNWPRKK